MIFLELYYTPFHFNCIFESCYLLIRQRLHIGTSFCVHRNFCTPLWQIQSFVVNNSQTVSLVIGTKIMVANSDGTCSWFQVRNKATKLAMAVHGTKMKFWFPNISNIQAGVIFLNFPLFLDLWGEKLWILHHPLGAAADSQHFTAWAAEPWESARTSATVGVFEVS